MSGSELAYIGAGKTIIDMLIGLLRGSAEDKKKFLNQHVVPLQTKLTNVHKDYVATFQEVQKHLQDRSKPPSYILGFLRERKRSYQHEHKLVMDLATEIGLPENRRFRSKKLKSAVSAYCSAVLEYFGTTQEISYPSWYTQFIDIVERNLKYEFIDVWATSAITESPCQVLLEIVNALLDQSLPDAFGRVSEAYAKLRLCLV